jgi:hypothetical protein
LRHFLRNKEAEPLISDRNSDLFRVFDEDEKLLWWFFLGTGFRESEVAIALQWVPRFVPGIRHPAFLPVGHGVWLLTVSPRAGVILTPQRRFSVLARPRHKYSEILKSSNAIA